MSQYKEIAKLIAKKVKDPSGWMLALREIVEMIGVDPTSVICINSSSFELACFSTINNINPFFGKVESEKKLAVALALWDKK